MYCKTVKFVCSFILIYIHLLQKVNGIIDTWIFPYTQIVINFELILSAALVINIQQWMQTLHVMLKAFQNSQILQNTASYPLINW